TLRSLVEHEIQVLLVAGNHDSPRRLEAMGQLAELVRVYAQHRVRRHDDGGVLTIAGREHTAQVAAIPWVQEGRIVDAAAMLGLEHENRQTYAEQAANVYRHMTEGFTRG